MQKHDWSIVLAEGSDGHDPQDAPARVGCPVVVPPQVWPREPTHADKQPGRR
jgi:hypothetical protein